MTLTALAPKVRDGLVALVRASSLALATGRPGELVPLLQRPALLVFAACAAAAGAAAAAILVQTRGGFWPHLILPDFSRIGGGGRLARLFRREVLTDLGLSLVKIVTVG